MLAEGNPSYHRIRTKVLEERRPEAIHPDGSLPNKSTLQARLFSEGRANIAASESRL